MDKIIRSTIKKHIPKPIIYRLQKSIKNYKSIKARKIFKQSIAKPCWIDSQELDNLYNKYPYPSGYGYDPETLRLRGQERATEIQKLIENRESEFTNFLELACCDGMVSCALQQYNNKTTAIDIHAEGFDYRAKRAGVKFFQMDAADLKFQDESFDFVFSYAAFEHFEHPKTILSEAHRVTKKGGYIYLKFGPLYRSAFGLHVYRSIPIPYCQFLFSPETLFDFADMMRIDAPNYENLNQWSLIDYRYLWNQYSSKLHPVKYYEHINVSHLDLISQYTSCFKSKTDNFDDLIVAEIEVLFHKKE